MMKIIPAMLLLSVLVAGASVGAAAYIPMPAPALERSARVEDAGEKKGTKKDEASSADEKTVIKKKAIRYSIAVAVPVNFYIVSILTWDYANTTKFRWANEHFLGQHTYAGGNDKMAHIFSFYIATRVLYQVFNYTESGGAMKWFYTLFIPGFLSWGVEVGDGFCKKQNGFSYEDLLFSHIGIAAGAILERFPLVDGFVGISCEYYPTKELRRHPAKLGFFLDDYSGWKFMVNIKLAGFKNAGLKAPEFLRFIMIDVGYHSMGYTEYDNSFTSRVYNRFHYSIGHKRREAFIGVSINCAEIVKEFFTDKESFACRAAQQPFKYYHIPVGYKQNFNLSR